MDTKLIKFPKMCPQWPGFKSRNEHASEVSFYEYYNGSAIANSYHYRYYAIRYGPENVPVSGEIHEAGSLILKYENNTRSKFDRHRTWSKNIFETKSAW